MDRKHSIDQLMHACGAMAPWHATVEAPGGASAFTKTFSLPFALVGRNGDSDLPLSDEAVSTRHAYVQVIRGRFFCVDLGSRTGTHWGGESQFSGWLAPLQPVRIGPFLARFTGDWPGGAAAAGSEPNPLASRSAGEDLLPNVLLTFFRGATQLATGRLTRTLTLVGNSRRCRVVLADPKASHIHCSLLRTPAGVWAIDLLPPRAGILLNGKRVRWGRLEDGDELQVGDVRIAVRQSFPAAPGPANGFREPAAVFSTPPANPAFPVPGASPFDTDGNQGPGTNLSVPALLPVNEIAPGAMMPQRPGPFGVFDPSFPTPVLPAGSEPFLMNLAYQFGAMQQHMFEQFQQTMLMMAQTFTALHRDQQELIRHELDRARELTREIQALQAELARRPPPHDTASSAAREAGRPPNFRQEQNPPQHVGKSRPDRSTGQPQSESRPDRSGAAPSHSPAAEESPSPADAQSYGNMHALIAQRIQAMQKERESYWQRIMNLLAGK